MSPYFLEVLRRGPLGTVKDRFWVEDMDLVGEVNCALEEDILGGGLSPYFLEVLRRGPLGTVKDRFWVEDGGLDKLRMRCTRSLCFWTADCTGGDKTGATLL